MPGLLSGDSPGAAPTTYHTNQLISDDESQSRQGEAVRFTVYGLGSQEANLSKEAMWPHVQPAEQAATSKPGRRECSEFRLYLSSSWLL